MIYTSDHEPAHIYGDGQMKVSIAGADGLPEIVFSLGMKTRDRRRAMDVVKERQAELMARWLEIRGDEEWRRIGPTRRSRRRRGAAAS